MSNKKHSLIYYISRQSKLISDPEFIINLLERGLIINLDQTLITNITHFCHYRCKIEIVKLLSTWHLLKEINELKTIINEYQKENHFLKENLLLYPESKFVEDLKDEFFNKANQFNLN